MNEQRYADPVRSGVLLGLVLLASFVVAGRGIGASGAFAASAGRLVEMAGASVVMPPPLADRIPTGVPLLHDWIFLEILGVMLGGFLSAMIAGRLAPHAHADRRRLARALFGGTLMGAGARLAYGCTSGLALTGGALLVTGAWVFIPLAFGTAILVARVARRGER